MSQLGKKNTKQKNKGFIPDPDPFRQFFTWYVKSVKSRLTDPGAMFLATVSPEGRPSGRIVLLKGYSEQGFTFFTDYESRKGRELSQNPYAALTFFWNENRQQVRVEGRVVKVSRKETLGYFNSRPRGSRISAVISPQSQVIPDRRFLESAWMKAYRKLSGKMPQCPSHWGGYRLIPYRFEFWQEGEHRLHDRIQYTLKRKSWVIERLAP